MAGRAPPSQKNVLISTLGGSPKTVTEALSALVFKGVDLSEVHLVKTLGVSRLPRFVEREFPSLLWVYHEIDVPDIDSYSSARKALAVIFTTVHELKKRDLRLYLDLTGGRKPMSAYLMLGAQIFCDENDTLYHVEPLDPLLSDPDSPKWFPVSEREIRLVDVPFLRLGFLKDIATSWGLSIDPSKPDDTIRELTFALNELALLGFGSQALAHEMGEEVGYLYHILKGNVVDEVVGSLENLRGLVEYIFLFAGTLPEVPLTELSIKKVASLAIRDFHFKRGKRLGFVLEGEDFKIESNEVLLRRVFRNLFENSLNAEASEINMFFDERSRCVEISDNGKGVPREIKERLFSLNRRGKQGRGLGLLAVKKILDCLGAEIVYVDSARKTTFKIIFRKP